MKYVLQLNIQISQGSVATDLRWCGRIYFTIFSVYLQM